MLHEHDDEWKKKEAPLNDTFIHLFKDLLSSEALHRIKRTVLGIGTIFPPLPTHTAFGRRKRKDLRDMLRSLQRDEQSIFNLMFVRMSIIPPRLRNVKAWRDVWGRWKEASIEKCFIYISTTNKSLWLIVKLFNVSQKFNRSNFLLKFSNSFNVNEKRLSTFDNPFRNLISSLLAAFIAQFDFKWEIDFSSYTHFLLPLLQNMVLEAKSRLGENTTSFKKILVFFLSRKIVRCMKISHQWFLERINAEPSQIKLTNSFETFQSTFSKHHSMRGGDGDEAKEW